MFKSLSRNLFQEIDEVTSTSNAVKGPGRATEKDEDDEINKRTDKTSGSEDLTMALSVKCLTLLKKNREM